MHRTFPRPQLSEKPTWFWAIYGALTWGVAMFVLFGLIADHARHWLTNLLVWFIAGALWGVATIRLTRRRGARKRRRNS